MNKRKALTLLLSLAILLSLALPAATARADDGGISEDNGDINEVGTEIEDLKVNKTAVYNAETGRYTITLEAYATGASTFITQDIPTDFILVLDQSGSMKEPIGGYTYTAYRSGGYNSRNYYNDEYFPLRHNGGSENLWHKLNDNEYVAVSVEQEMKYAPISEWSNWDYYDNQNSLYCLVSGEYKSVAVKREGHLFSSDKYWYTVEGQQILYTTGDSSIPNFGQYAPLYQSVKKYTYSYTLNGATTVIEESFGDGSSPNTQFYSRGYSSSAGGTRLNALKNAATTFANAVAAKAAGEDGNINTPADNVNHRIAVVGFASGQYYNGYNYNYGNTEVFVGSEQYRYGSAAQGQYGNAFQDMNTSTGVGNVSASIGALSADGGTFTNLGLEMGNGIFGANPIAEGEKRNRVVIVFSDGVPGWSGYDSNTANSAITQAETAKNTYGAKVYSIGIFPGADATSAGNQNGNETEKANWFMQQVSSNNGTPQSSSYYLSASDEGTLNSIFHQISQQIPTGGSNTELSSNAIVKDIISPYFMLPVGANEKSITLETYQYHGPDAPQEWTKNADAMGATATVTGKEVSVTNFDFAKNWCGTEENAQGSTNFRGNKLVIRFDVTPEPDFLGGNDVPTNNTSAGIYKEGETEPSKTFPLPLVNVPIQNVTVTAEDKNVYLLHTMTGEECKEGATAQCNGVNLLDETAYTGENAWKAAFVNITTEVKPPNSALTGDADYTIEVTVAPKTEATDTTEKGPAATEQKDTATAKINVFKPELTYKDSTAYYGEAVPANNDYSSNRVGTEKWMHDGTEAVPSEMLGTKPTLDITYTPDESKLDNGKYTKQDVPVKATVKIGTENVNEHTTFVHQDCTGKTCTLTEGYHFWIHIQTCTLTITKTGGAENESYAFVVKKDGQPYSEVSIYGNGSQTIYELPVGTYTIAEDGDWSWRYDGDNGGNGVTLSAEEPNGTITCTNTHNDNKLWLNGFSEIVRNIFGQASTPATDANN